MRRSPLFAAVVLTSPLVSLAAIGWNSEWRFGNTGAYASGTGGRYTQLSNASAAINGGGWGVQPPREADGPQFADYFNDFDVITFTNVTIPAYAAGRNFALQTRAGGNNLQRFTVDFLNPGTSTVVHTYDVYRTRQTTWENDGWTYNVVSGAAAGTFDVRVTNASSGGHFAGVGTFNSRVLGASNTLYSTDYTWGDGSKWFNTPDGNTTRQYLDNKFSNTPDNPPSGTNNGNWVDYEIFNPNGATPYSVSAFVRHGMGTNVTLHIESIDANGDITPLTTMVIPSTGWQGSDFYLRDAISSITLPQGFSNLRLWSDAPLHYDYMTLTAVPEPATLGLLGAAAVLMLRRRSV